MIGEGCAEGPPAVRIVRPGWSLVPMFAALACQEAMCVKLAGYRLFYAWGNAGRKLHYERR